MRHAANIVKKAEIAARREANQARWSLLTEEQQEVERQESHEKRAARDAEKLYNKREKVRLAQAEREAKEANYQDGLHMTEQEKADANREYDRAYPEDTVTEREARYKKAYEKRMVPAYKNPSSHERNALRDTARGDYAATGDPNSEDAEERKYALHSMKQFKGVPSEYAIA